MTSQKFLHIEIPATDTSAAGAFYHDVFGWQTVTNQEHNYTTFETEQGFRGGFVNPSTPTYKPDRLLVYLPTDDIDATLAEVEAHGGKTVIAKTIIPHVGEWAVFADPAGNQVGLFIRLQNN